MCSDGYWGNMSSRQSKAGSLQRTVKEMTHRSPHDEPVFCSIKIQGYVSQRLVENLGLSVSVSDETDRIVTTLTGQVIDQAALMGILNGLYDMGYHLLAVEFQS
jgi:hypothetical protein